MELKHKADVAVAEGGQFAFFHPLHGCPINEDCARIWTIQRAHDLQQRGLACAAGADDAHHFAPCYLQADAP